MSRQISMLVLFPGLGGSSSSHSNDLDRPALSDIEASSKWLLAQSSTATYDSDTCNNPMHFFTLVTLLTWQTTTIQLFLQGKRDTGE